MAGKKGPAEGSKKAAGQARKADAAAAKVSVENAKKADIEDAEWEGGAKNSAKKEAEAAKKAELARKKAERDAMLQDEEKNTPGRAPKNAKTAQKKTNTAAPSRGLDLSQLEGEPSKDGPLAALNASGIDNALDLLSLSASGGGQGATVDRHPERRFKAAYAAYEERRLKEMDSDGSGQGLRQRQKQDKIRKEFERSPENPFNQVTANYDTGKDELKQIKEQEKAKIEQRLASK